VKRFRKVNNQNGAAMVEFAIVLPLLLMLLFGMIEFSIMLYDKAMLTNATREGARFGILYVDSANGNSVKDIQGTVENYLLNNLISLGDPNATWTTSVFSIEENGAVTISGTCTAAGARASIMVTVTYPYDFLVFPNIQKLMDFDPLSDTLTLSATTTMRCE
jgi:Flp pilus assembly protein TadG